MPAQLDRRNFLNLALSTTGGMVMFPSNELIAVSAPVISPRAKTPLDKLILHCVKPWTADVSFDQRFESYMNTLEVVDHHIDHANGGRVTRGDLEIFGLLFWQGHPSHTSPRDPMRHLFLVAAFRQSKLVLEGGLGDAESLKDYDQFLGAEVQRLGPCEVAAELEEALLRADPCSQVQMKDDDLNCCMMYNAVRTLKNHGLPLGLRAQQVLWKDEEDEIQARWEEARPGYWHAHWTQEEV